MCSLEVVVYRMGLFAVGVVVILAASVDKGRTADAGLTREMARTVLDAALVGAEKLGVAMNIVILDAKDARKVFFRMDGAPVDRIAAAESRAKTARRGASSLSGKNGIEVFGFATEADGRVVYGGGEQLRDSGGRVIGAIGVSGGTVAQNVAVAGAGAKALAAAMRQE